MRPTCVLLKHHVGRMIKNHWKVQGRKKILDNGSLSVLKENGIPVVNAVDFVNEEFEAPKPSSTKTELEVQNAVELVEHLSFNDTNVPICGLDQAKVFTNSIEIFPESMTNTDVEGGFVRHDLVKRCIESSLIYDAYQEKLPKRTDPERPAWVFPVDYGLTDRRKNHLLCNRLIQLCSSLNPQLLPHRRTLYNAMFNTTVKRDNENVLLSLRADILLTSNQGLEPPSNSIDINSNKKDEDIPNISPLLSTISMSKEITPRKDFVDILPFLPGFDKCNIHTAVVHYNGTETTNLHDSEVTRDQFLGRSLMKAYTFALSEARRLYGKHVEDKLPAPVTVQCVHTNAQDFHFGIIQLNTVKDSTETDERNFYWSLPVQTLYKTCGYESAKPVLEEYNPAVFNTLFAFCCNS